MSIKSRAKRGVKRFYKRDWRGRFATTGSAKRAAPKKRSAARRRSKSANVKYFAKGMGKGYKKHPEYIAATVAGAAIFAASIAGSKQTRKHNAAVHSAWMKTASKFPPMPADLSKNLFADLAKRPTMKAKAGRMGGSYSSPALKGRRIKR